MNLTQRVKCLTVPKYNWSFAFVEANEYLMIGWINQFLRALIIKDILNTPYNLFVMKSS